ncbi:MAG: S41 family peptidase [Thermonemataceae bacterium]|nr:S41 family peptidase [Thermonemataceae bacterium]
MKKRVIPTVLTTFLLLFSFVAFKKDPEDNAFEIAKNIEIFTTLYKEVNNYYVDELNPNQTMRTALDAMLKSLDPYTVFYSEDQIEDYRTMTTGEYIGIGASVGVRNGKVLVLMPMPNSPALKGGLKIGDEILQINEVKTKGKTQNEISRLLKGQANTDVELKIKRYGSEQVETIKLKREKIKIDNLPISQMVDKEIGYIHLTEFTAGASKEIEKALKELKNQGAKSLILDLRGNPGGLLNEAVNICNLFIEQDLEVVSTKGKIKDWNKTYKSLFKTFDKEIPLVILINGRSASASEIVSGVIQDYDRGVLIGQRSFGKGLVQSTRPLSFNTQVKITVAKYYIPSGRCIQALDYSHKDSKGKATKIPDSLRKPFKTKAGRVFYDGAGLDPDITLPTPKESPILKGLLEANLIFDYANTYTLKNPKIISAKDFQLTDAEYKEFLTWIKNQKYNYKTEMEKTYTELEEAAREDKKYEAMQNDLNALKAKINKSKENDLLTFQKEIKERLEEEIVARYYLEQGVLENKLQKDNELKEAIQILKNPSKYKQILSKK